MNTYITVDVVRAVGRGQNVIVPVDCVLLLTPVSVSSTGRVVEESPTRFRVKDGVIAGGGAWVVPGTYLISVSNARMSSFYVEIPEGYTEEEPFNIATTMPINMKVSPPWYPTREQMLHIVKVHEDMGIAVDQVLASVAEANSHADRSEDVLRATQEAVSDLPRLIQEAVDAGDYTGPTGRGIASIENRDGDGTATVTYTDGTVEELSLPFPEIMWEGSSLVVGGQKSPDLTGRTGPAPETSWNGPRLTVGDATSPDLTGPQGAPGAVPTAQDYLVVGPGRPDDPATTGMSTEALEALPVGAEYRSTDGASINAWGWRKRPTGWVVTDQDAE